MTVQRRANAQVGFTLVELLVVIAIIGVLVALLLPAIQAAREAARRTQCQNHMKQIGLSVLNYESALRELPSGGWGYAWSGDPDMGTGEKQPGGWAFSILPYLENTNVYVVGAGLTGTQKMTALAKQKAQPIEVFYCPSRRSATVYYGPEASKNAFTPDGGYVAKTDYAANGGSYSPAELSPLTWSDGPSNADCMTKFPNCDWNSYSHSAISTYMDGVVLPRVPVELRQITDGTANTIFAGEKYLHRDFYGDGVELSINSCADNNSLFQGYDWDVIRWATSFKDAKLDYAPQSDSFGIPAAQACAVRYGGPHPGLFYAVFCDNSVRGISFDVDLPELEMMASRDDGGQAGTPPGS